MRVERVCDGAVESVVDTCGGTVSGHECCVHLHLLFTVAVARSLIPFIFVLAFFAGVGVKLVGEVFNGKRDSASMGGGRAKFL